MRIFVVSLLASSFTLWGNLVIVMSAKVERAFKKYKKMQV